MRLDRRAVAMLARALSRSRHAEGLGWPGALVDLERELVTVISDQSRPEVTISLDDGTGPADDTPMTYSQAAERLGCSVSTVRRMVDRGELAVFSVGRRPRIHPDTLDAYLKRRDRG